jgi:hypothetical protein
MFQTYHAPTCFQTPMTKLGCELISIFQPWRNVKSASAKTGRLGVLAELGLVIVMVFLTATT